MIKRVGIDLDSTVANYMDGAIPLLKEHYGLEPDFTKEAYTIEEVFGLTKETRPPGMRKKLYEDLHLFLNLPKLENDIEKLTHGLSLYAKIYIVTARSATPIIVEDSISWLKNNNFWFDDIFFTDKKAELCKLMDIDVMIEDEVGQLMNLRRVGIDLIVPDQPWNRHLPRDPHSQVEESGKVTRVHNWREALAAAEGYLL